ncbi:MAG: single-stranded DNA-binding protein [Bacilli bacterium]|nr:single-stranded DNA-binding protein [Bacilli bacterium]
MLNQVILVGRLTGEVKVEKGENGINSTSLVLAIPRSFKNADGIYETDFIDVKLFGTVATNTIEYCKKGDIIGIRGIIQTKKIEKYHTKMQIQEIIAERVTFLSNGKGD